MYCMLKYVKKKNLCCFKVQYMYLQKEINVFNKILFKFNSIHYKCIIYVYYNNAPLVQQ